jgi:tRNA A-37 threonylcarbamoyl transferase component Bud32/tetratricopeptide (TPR) repeat protein
VTNPLRDQLQAALGGTYEIDRELGGGGMSRVFVATEAAFGRKVVIKVLPPEMTEGLSVDRFKREIALAARLQHPHIVPVHTAGEIDGLPYFTMPFVEGHSLRDLVAKTGALSITTAIGIMRDVAKALAYAHDQGVVHRDIKPDNVLLTGGSAVVTDFGVAKALSASKAQAPGGTLTQVGTSLGTPAYMAPEQAAADPDTDHRADIYAFGVMSYEMLAGQPPFHGRTPQKLLAAHMGERPETIESARADVPPLLAELVMRCLEKEPDRRPQSAIELVKILETVTSGGGYPAMPAILIGGQRRLATVLGMYAVAFIAVAIVARAAVIALGLPDWVFPGALIVMALGLPVILFTAFVHRGTHRALTESALTPHGSPVTQSTMTRIAVKASPWVSWRRTYAGGAVALGAFAVLVAAFMIMRATGIGPVGSLLASGRLTERDQLLVTDFRGGGADSSLSAIVTEAIRTDLGQSSVVKVVPPSAVAAALERMRRDRNSTVDLAVAREIAAREGIKGIVDGSVTPLAGGYVVSVRLVDAATGDGLASFRETIDGPSELLPTLDKLSGNLRGKIGESLKKVRANPPLERVTTSSLEALRKYADGMRAFDVEGDNAKAIAFFREAVAIDTAFGMAYRKLGVALGNAGMSRASRDSALEAAYRHRLRMTDVERLLTTGSYFGSGAHYDRKLSADAYEALLQIDSLNFSAANNLAIQLVERREYARAESILRRVLESGIARATLFMNLADALVRQGKFAAADSTAALARQKLPQNANLRGIDLAVLTGRRQFDSLEKRGVSLKANDPDVANRAAAAFGLRDLAYIRGRIREGLRYDQEAYALDEARGNPAPVYSRSLDSAWVEIRHLDQAARGTQRLDEALARTSPSSVPVDGRRYTVFALLYALGGRPDRARQILASYNSADTAYRRRTEPEYHGALGEIALAERRPLDAIREFRLGDRRPDGPRDSCAGCTYEQLARAFDAANMQDSAIVMYTRYVTTPSPFTWPDEWGLARAHRRLGELHDAKGDLTRARRHYEMFVELWKNADPELQPKVAAVRARLAALQKR